MTRITATSGTDALRGAGAAGGGLGKVAGRADAAEGTGRAGAAGGIERAAGPAVPMAAADAGAPGAKRPTGVTGPTGTASAAGPAAGPARETARPTAPATRAGAAGASRMPADIAPGRADHGVAARRDAEPDEAERRAPGRPRSARADEAIIEAVLDLLGEGSIEALSIEAVAARAGVGKATIYRRWPNKEALVMDAIAAIKGVPPEISGDSVRDDLIALLRPMATAHTTRAGRILPCLIPEIQRNPELHRLYRQLLEPRRNAIRGVLLRGMEFGQLRPDIDIDLTVALLVSPMIVQTMLRLQPELDVQKLPEQIVDGVLPGVLA